MTDTYRERIEQAKRLIEQRLDEELPLSEIARAAHFSTFHFHRLFRGLTGETVREHTRRLRLERAAHRLTTTDQDILTIAMDAGYASNEAFTRAFKARFETTPSSWRDDRRQLTSRKEPAMPETTIDVRIEKRDPAALACVRHVGPYTAVGDAWGALMKWGWSKMMFGKAETFGLCHDDPEVTPADQLRYDACMVVKPGTKVKPPVELRDHPGGTYAVALHEGSYESIGKTYAALFAHVANERMEDRQWTLADPPSLEKYLNDPRKTPPDELRTEIWMPVN